MFPPSYCAPKIRTGSPGYPPVSQPPWSVRLQLAPPPWSVQLKWIFHENFDTNAPFVTREVMLARMESYIKQVFEKLDEYGYTDLFYAYDVVNEAWMEDGKIREEMNFWYQIIGEDYLWHAFNYANKYAPESIDLYYNDYNEQYKTDALLKFVDTLVDEEGNYLIDGIGLQAHIPFSRAQSSILTMSVLNSTTRSPASILAVLSRI